MDNNLENIENIENIEKMEEESSTKKANQFIKNCETNP